MKCSSTPLSDLFGVVPRQLCKVWITSLRLCWKTVLVVTADAHSPWGFS